MRTLLSLCIIALDIAAIVEVVKSAKESGKKALWILLILFLPLLGLILYFFLGRGDKK